MKIVFLVHEMGGAGRAARATADLALALAADHRVELVCRADAGPWLAAVGPRSRVGVVPLDGPRRRLDAYLRRTGADVVVATHPELVAHLADADQPRFARFVRIGQELRGFAAHDEKLRFRQLAALPGLDAFVTFSEADAARYRAALPEGSATRVVSIPGCVPALGLAPASGASRVIIAAGPLVPDRGYDRLIDAFAKIAPQRPGWTLRIYGGGSLGDSLQRRIHGLGLGLYNRVRLMGPLPPAEKMETEWIKGAIAAVTASSAAGESAALTAVEAMRCGLPVVATDCACGPAEVITHGHDGLLVPHEGGSDTFAHALLRLIDNPAERRAMAAAALTTAADHNPAGVAHRYVTLARELLRLPGHRGRWLRGALARAASAGVRTPRATQPRPAAEENGQAARPRTRARCVVSENGSLTVLLDTATLPAASGLLDFVAQQREAPGGRQRIRIPIRRELDGAHLKVTLERSARVLPEGRWDCYVEPRDEGHRRRLAAEAIDAAALVTLPPTVDEHGVACWLPYTTSEGDLSLRTWLRRAHAEVEQILMGEEAATVTVALLGPAARRPGPEARAVAIARSRGGVDVDVPLRVLPSGGQGEPMRAEFAVPYDALLAERDPDCGRNIWDLKLILTTGCGIVPVGRIGGDCIDRTKTDKFPAVLRAGNRLRPFFTAPHGLAISAEAAEESGESGASGAG
ncbi:glycosyltransferase [Streptomyces sp. 6N223]|uniref:glycosyltransferase n=1 Tax=Streptomyces sp. 6N223 TaxID=3457412 RepID=UPI003FD100A3